MILISLNKNSRKNRQLDSGLQIIIERFKRRIDKHQDSGDRTERNAC